MTEGRTSNHHEALVTATHALHLLTLFSDEHPELGVTEMSERLGLAKSIVSRIVSTYVTEGVLVQDEITRRYRLGPLLLELGLIAGELHPVREAAETPLKALRDETGQNTALWLRGVGDEALCLASHRGAKAVGPPVPAGTRIKLSDIVAGQALLKTERGIWHGCEASASPDAWQGPGVEWASVERTGREAGFGRDVEWAGDRTSRKAGNGGVWITSEPTDRSVYTAACCIADSSGEAVAVITLSAPEAWFESQPPSRVEVAITRVARDVSATLS